MKYSILKWFAFFLLVIFARDSIGQNLKLDILNMCANSTSCNPFVSGYTCQDAILRTTHGSPQFYLPTTNQTRQIQLEAQLATNGVVYSEGFTLQYHFYVGKTYTVKINYMGMPSTDAVSYPTLVADLTNSPPRFDDGCDLGYLTSVDNVAEFPFTVSSTAVTSSFDIQPTQDIFFLWLRSFPNQVAKAGLLIFSIEIVDHSVSPPPTTKACYGELDFCDPHWNWAGSFDYAVNSPITIHCDAFTTAFDPGTAFYRRFSAPKIILVPGFAASALDYRTTNPTFRAVASATPCNPPWRRLIVTDTVKAIKRTIKIDEQVTDNILVYPSPSKGMVKIAGNESALSNSVITVVDQSGRVVYQKNNKSGYAPIELDLQHLSNGVYFIKINAPNKTSVQKLLINK